MQSTEINILWCESDNNWLSKEERVCSCYHWRERNGGYNKKKLMVTFQVINIWPIIFILFFNFSLFYCELQMLLIWSRYTSAVERIKKLTATGPLNIHSFSSCKILIPKMYQSKWLNLSHIQPIESVLVIRYLSKSWGKWYIWIRHLSVYIWLYVRIRKGFQY